MSTAVVSVKRLSGHRRHSTPNIKTRASTSSATNVTTIKVKQPSSNKGCEKSHNRSDSKQCTNSPNWTLATRPSSCPLAGPNIELIAEAPNQVINDPRKLKRFDSCPPDTDTSHVCQSGFVEVGGLRKRTSSWSYHAKENSNSDEEKSLSRRGSNGPSGTTTYPPSSKLSNSKSNVRHQTKTQGENCHDHKIRIIVGDSGDVETSSMPLSVVSHQRPPRYDEPFSSNSNYRDQTKSSFFTAKKENHCVTANACSAIANTVPSPHSSLHTSVISISNGNKISDGAISVSSGRGGTDLCPPPTSFNRSGGMGNSLLFKSNLSTISSESEAAISSLPDAGDELPECLRQGSFLCIFICISDFIKKEIAFEFEF